MLSKSCFFEGPVHVPQTEERHQTIMLWPATFPSPHQSHSRYGSHISKVMVRSWHDIALDRVSVETVKDNSQRFQTSTAQIKLTIMARKTHSNLRALANLRIYPNRSPFFCSSSYHDFSSALPPNEKFPMGGCDTVTVCSFNSFVHITVRNPHTTHLQNGLHSAYSTSFLWYVCPST